MTSWVARRTGVAPTPAPTSRRSDRAVLDEATRPSAPEPAPDVAFGGPAAAGAHLVQVHDHYRAELARVRQVLDQVRAGAASVGAARSELNAMTIRANDWTLGGICQAQCVSLTQHHELESDGIFPHLRRAQPDLADVLDRLHREHRAIHEVLREVDSALVHLVTTDGDHDPIVRAIDLLTDTLQSHFAYEERELIAPLARHGMFPGQV